jgi:hypothetical protein
VPDLAHQLVAADDVTGALHQRLHEVELLAGQDDLVRTPPDTAGRGIEPYVLHLDHLPTLGTSGTACGSTERILL